MATRRNRVLNAAVSRRMSKNELRAMTKFQERQQRKAKKPTIPKEKKP